MMNKAVALAGLLSLILTVIHIVGGGADVHEPILASELDNILKGYSSVIWHGVTANLFLCSAILFYASISKPNLPTLTSIVIVQYLAYAVIFIFYGTTRFGSIMIMPQWIAFLIIPAIATFGIYLSHSASGQAPTK
jgi:hypothetical protein